ncbi:putative serine/threonine-protein kinase-like protein CCR3 [Jatropha curcas]|uniref:putative serine/threonine-protein kinase-like protein CCR3 n=1 Tax=Jatropha curcas TaxID=180498 RepID=UPI0018946EC4|nr:putative serine/threonine-protein kinase-like protein CCR3 [Jatropha curcas]
MSESLHIHIKEEGNHHEKANRKGDHFKNKATNPESIVLIANFILELPSAVFDQLSSVHKLQFALLSMLISFTVSIISIVDLVYKGRKERFTLMKRGLIPWFYYPYPNLKPFGTFTDIIGLLFAIFQCFFATIAYAFLSRHSDNPIKVSILPIIFAFGLLYSRLSRNYYAQRNLNPTPFVRRLNRVQEFTLVELVTATNNFSLESKLGEGRYGDVYKGKLADGREVAIKREITQQRNKSEDEPSAFESELTFISRLHHKHLVRLVGYCEEKNQRFIVYEYLKNGDLYSYLHDENNIDKDRIMFDSWKMRIKIALEAARGIEYLHNYAVPPIIHRNITSLNILLDGNWTVRICDFVFSSVVLETEYSDGQKKAAATVGYTDPDYYCGNVLTAKSDIYSLGVVLLELLTGKKAIFRDHYDGDISRSLVDFVVPKILANELVKVLDHRIGPPESANEVEAVEMMAYTALHCVNSERNNRPNIAGVVANLEQALSLSHGRMEDYLAGEGEGQQNGGSNETKPKLLNNETEHHQ